MMSIEQWKGRIRRRRRAIGYLVGNWLAGEQIGGAATSGSGSATLRVINPDLKPEEIKVEGEDAYACDWLGRVEFGERLEKLVSYGSGTGVILVDSAWGNGKTTFMRMWMYAMRQKGHVVAEINAWRGDYSENPLDNIAEQLQEELTRQIAGRFSGLWRWIIGCRILGWLGIPWLLVVVTVMFDGGTSAATLKAAFAALAIGLEKAKRIGTSDQKKLSKLSRKVEKAASKFWKDTRLVIVVDELGPVEASAKIRRSRFDLGGMPSHRRALLSYSGAGPAAADHHADLRAWSPSRATDGLALNGGARWCRREHVLGKSVERPHATANRYAIQILSLADRPGTGANAPIAKGPPPGLG